MRRWVRLVFALATLTPLFSGCDGGSSADGSTSWLSPCEVSSECMAGLKCICGRCTKQCQAPRDCEDLGSETVCASARGLGECSVTQANYVVCVRRSLDAGLDASGLTRDATPSTAPDTGSSSPETGGAPSEASAEGASANGGGADAGAGGSSGARGAEAGIAGAEAGACPDSDGDRVCDAVDLCPGADDANDSDGDGRPDGCEPALLREFDTGTDNAGVTNIALTTDHVYFTGSTKSGDGKVGIWRTNLDGTGLTPISDLTATGILQGSLEMLNDRFAYASDPVASVWAGPIEGGTADRLSANLAVASTTWSLVAKPFLYFTTAGGTPGLSRTDGTTGGTLALTAAPASSWTLMSADAASGAYFSDSDGAVWHTDGTVAGTVNLGHGLKDTGGGVLLGGELYFTAVEGGALDRSLWKSDGTVAGTIRVPVSLPSSAGLFGVWASSSTRLFAGGYDDSGQTVWVISPDGSFTARIDRRVDAVYSSPSQGYILSEGQLYTVDDSATTTKAFDGSPQGIVPTPNGVYFSTCDDVSDSAYPCRLLRLDQNGVVELARHLASDGGLVLRSTSVLGDRMAFGAGTAAFGEEPWISDGTPQGTHQLLDANPTPLDSVLGFWGSFSPDSDAFVLGIAANGAAAPSGTPPSLVLYDGAALKTIDTVLGMPTVKAWGGDLFLLNPATGARRVDPSGHVDSVQQTSPTLENGIVFGDRVIFGSNELLSLPLSILTGPNPSTESAEAFFEPPTPSSTQPLWTWKDSVWFLVTDGGGGAHLWKSDGTFGGAEEIAPAIASQTHAELDGQLFFSGQNGNMYRTDGTKSGTVEVPGALAVSTYPGGFLAFAGHVYFSMTKDGNTGFYRTDGTTIEVVAATLAPNAFVVLGSHLVARDVYGDLWSTDGSAPPVALKATTTPTMVLYRGALYFSGNDPEHGDELWRTDGTAAGTVLDTDIVPGPGSSSPDYFFATNKSLFFMATTPEYGREPWIMRH